MDDVIRIEDRYYIAASSSLAEGGSQVLKRGDTFLIAGQRGNIRSLGVEDQGLFFEGTRYLSRYQLTIEGKRPLLLSSAVSDDNRLYAIDLTNPDFETAEGHKVHNGSIHLHRQIFLGPRSFHESIRITNFSQETITFRLTLEFEADFADIFEIRGAVRRKRGRQRDASLDADSLVLGYQGLDGVERLTKIDLDPEPAQLSNSHAVYLLRLAPHEETRLFVVANCSAGRVPAAADEVERPFWRALEEVREIDRGRHSAVCKIETSNEQFNDWLERSLSDTLMMLSETGHGLYPYAGIPWYSTVFGRDGIITALQTLWLYPEVARGVLSFLAAHQAQEREPEREAEPGKIVHEMRAGEMAALGEIPFGRYYGTADATPLFLVLAGRYFEATGDLRFCEQLWPHVERALGWIDDYGDLDGDGFVEYARRSENGLVNQGWKDSNDSVFHEDGALAQGPIALCEVQAYVFEAKLMSSRMAAALGRTELAHGLQKQAERLRELFLESFWSPELGTYVLALDGQKRQCRVRSSNAGHALYCGIAHPEQAPSVVRTLMMPESFAGWGIRTIPFGEPRYNPMSYHNGSIWPHDNAIIAAGMARYGCTHEAQSVLSALFDVSTFVHLQRLPELYCGFHRRDGEGPTLYPVACSPQAWAAGSVFMMLQASLGLQVDALRRRILFERPLLPESVQELKLRGLRVGADSVDLAVRRHQNDVTIELLDRRGDVTLEIAK